MSLSQLNKILSNPTIKVLFTDYYDTLVHRTVHPNYTLRLWAKHLINELGLKASIDSLYFTRQESVSYLTKKFNCEDVELSYTVLKQEICKRLINAEILDVASKDHFLKIFELADIKSETSVQYINEETLSVLKTFKENGGQIYLVSDFYGPKSMFKAMLSHHKILELFDGIYSSSSLEKSKYRGSIYPELISELNLNPSEVLMIGDNKISDVIRAEAHNINAFLMPHKRHLKRNKLNNFGNDYKKLRAVINNVYKNCNKKNVQPFSEYIVFYHVFTERLYNKCKQENIKDLFFLSREGQFLKKLFDSYQEFSVVDEANKINTHYLRISRQASIQISLKPIDNEEFSYLRNNHSTLSIRDFLAFFSFDETSISTIIKSLNFNEDERIDDFFNSEIFKQIKASDLFRNQYESHRTKEHEAFVEYIDSFNVNIEENGVFLVDIGWGGTMQESIYKFFDKKLKVTGYYLGLKEIYTITEDTKREGLIFSVLPFETYNDHILMANTQLFEQFSAADHGSALGYSKNAENYTRQFHEPSEKWLYDNHIKAHQDFAFKIHEKILKDLNTICYSDEMIQKQISNLSLKVGLFQSQRKLKFLETLNKGFYQNIGDNQVGISYTPPKIDNRLKMILSFLMTPEKYFRYLVKLRPMLYGKNKLLAFFTPVYLIYLYFRFNKYLRFNVLSRRFLLKHNAFK